jgi:transposase
MLKAVADGATDPAALAALADKKLRATQAQLCDALGACAELQPVYRRLLKMFLEELHLIEQQIGQLDQEMAALLSQQPEAVQRLAEIPGLGVDSAQQIIAEVGATAATFPSGKHLSSWVGACPGDEESAEVSQSHRSPKGNRHMRQRGVRYEERGPSVSAKSRRHRTNRMIRELRSLGYRIEPLVATA